MRPLPLKKKHKAKLQILDEIEIFESVAETQSLLKIQYRERTLFTIQNMTNKSIRMYEYDEYGANEYWRLHL